MSLEGLKSQIKKLDLEKWVMDNCYYKGKRHSSHWCLELFRRKVVLAVVDAWAETNVCIDKKQLQNFYTWLKDTEWRGISSEVLEEFKDRFEKVFGVGGKE